MNEAKCAEAVVRWATNGLAQAQRELERLNYDEVGRIAKHQEWAKNNPDDGIGFGSANPYQKNAVVATQHALACKEVEDWTSLQNFVITRVCACVEPPKTNS